MKKVLILGSGLVASPIIRYLLGKGIRVTVASNTPDRAVEMIGGHQNGFSVDWDAGDEITLNSLIAEHHLTVSLLPWTFHLNVAKLCLKHRKNMVTTSYVKPEMKQLNRAARAAGVLFLNEIGLDPGIDHMSAMRIIDHIHNQEGAVLEFYSFCGALPAPEAADNPFKYKFSWSPQGVLMAGNNDGVYLRQGNVVTIPTQSLFKHPLLVNCPQVGDLEVYPNRDSLAYQDLYGIPEARTLFRGTFRYQGWCEILDYMKQLNLFSYDPVDLTGKTYRQFMEHQLAVGSNVIASVAKQGQLVASDPGSRIPDSGSNPGKALHWLGLYDNAPMNREMASPFDVVSDLMIGKMGLKENERDMILMQHTFLAGYSDGHKEVIRSRMLDFGIPGEETAIARTVSLPAAISAEMILNGEITATGVHIPVIPEIYNPVLNRLETMGISMEEEYGLPLTENIQ